MSTEEKYGKLRTMLRELGNTEECGKVSFSLGEWKKIDAEAFVLERLLDTITNSSKYSWYHFETWANQIENEQRYQSILTKWLFSISIRLRDMESK